LFQNIFFVSRWWGGGGCGGGGGLGCSTPPPPPKFQRPSKIVSNSTPLWKPLKIAEFRMPTHQDVRKKGSKILKLPPVRICFTLAKTNKLVVIINSLKVPKITKMLLYEIKFLVPNYSCLQNPWLGGYRPHIPILSVLCAQLNLLNPPPPEQNYWYATDARRNYSFGTVKTPNSTMQKPPGESNSPASQGTPHFHGTQRFITVVALARH